MSLITRSFDLRPSGLAAWYCQACGRIEARRDLCGCPHCGRKMQRSSRYEWFLCDSLSSILAFQGADFSIQQQYPLPNLRGFTWYFDLYVWVKGNAWGGGYGEFIEVNGSSHTVQKPYRRVGYTRDRDKFADATSFSPFRGSTVGYRIVRNEDCTRRRVFYTAVDIADVLMECAGS